MQCLLVPQVLDSIHPPNNLRVRLDTDGMRELRELLCLLLHTRKLIVYSMPLMGCDKKSSTDTTSEIFQGDNLEMINPQSQLVCQ